MQPVAKFAADQAEKKQDRAKKAASKKAADPARPKRPMSAFFLYLNDVRADTQKKNPTLKVTELTAHMSNAWKALDAEKKKPYELKAAAEKKRYDADVAKIPVSPKRGMSSYMFFANELREKRTKEGKPFEIAAFGKEAGALWKALSDKDKKPYEAKAVADKSRYEKEKEKQAAGLKA